MRPFVAGLIVMVLVVAQGSCSHGSRPEPPHAPPARTLPAFLASIPADTPYLVLALEAMPRDYYAKVATAVGPTFAGELEKRAAGSPDLAKFLAAVRRELDGKWNAAGLESLGFSSQPRFALYALGPAFVVRFELADQKKVLATVQRVAAAWGKPLPAPVTRAGATYWRIDEVKTSIVIGLAKDQLVFAVDGLARTDGDLDALLGLRDVPNNLADGALLRRVMDRHHLGPYLVGMVDTRRMIDLLASSSDSVSPACVAQLDTLSQLVPRIVLGHTQSNMKRFAGGVIAELAPELARELRTLRTAVPGLAPSLAADTIVALGAGIDLPAARALTRRAGGALETLATACGSARLHELASKLDDPTAFPIPSLLEPVTGVVLALQDYAPAADGSQMPQRLQGVGALGATDASRLFTALSSGVPWLATLGIDVDGALHAILQGVTPFGLFAGVGDRAIVLAAGDRGRTLAEQVIADKPDQDAPFIAMSYDYPRLVALERMLNRDKPPAPEAALEDAYAKLFGRGTLTLDVADDGLVLWSTIDLK